MSPDARAWARFFAETVLDKGIAVDEALMQGWFANAMMAMHDHLAAQAVQREASCAVCLAPASFETRTFHCSAHRPQGFSTWETGRPWFASQAKPQVEAKPPNATGAVDPHRCAKAEDGDRLRERTALEILLLSPLAELAGEASMCWDPKPGEQVFQSEAASAAAERCASRCADLVLERYPAQPRPGARPARHLNDSALVDAPWQSTRAWQGKACAACGAPAKHRTVDAEGWSWPACDRPECQAEPAVPANPDRDRADARLGRDLVAVLIHHAGERGDNEGAVEVLQRILRERDEATRKLAELTPGVEERT